MNAWKDEEYISLEKYANIHLFAYNILCINLYIYIAKAFHIILALCTIL